MNNEQLTKVLWRLIPQGGFSCGSSFKSIRVDGGIDKPTETALVEMLAVIKVDEQNYIIEQAKLAWLRGRTGEDGMGKGYAPIQEQLDMQYNDKVNNTTTWEDHIAKVKLDNPKP